MPVYFKISDPKGRLKACLEVNVSAQKPEERVADAEGNFKDGYLSAQH